MLAHLGSAGEVIMLEPIFGELSLRQILLALSIPVVFIGLACLFHIFLVRAARRLAQKTKTKLGDAIISALEKPVVVTLVLTGLYLSVRFLPLEAVLYSYLSKGLYITLYLLGIYAVAALVYALGVDIKILGDTKPIRQWDVMGELRKRLKKAFDEEGIEIPWPHTKVYFGNLPPYIRGNKASGT
jgi:small-conductance mechanosensitive channel